jgi:hypothetical protein
MYVHLHSRHDHRSTAMSGRIEKRYGRLGCRSDTARLRNIKSTNILLMSNLDAVQDSSDEDSADGRMVLG